MDARTTSHPQMETSSHELPNHLSSTLQASCQHDDDEHSVQAKLQKPNDNATQTSSPQLNDVTTEVVMCEQTDSSTQTSPLLRNDAATETIVLKQNNSSTQTDLPRVNNPFLQASLQQDMKQHLQDDFPSRSLTLSMPKGQTVIKLRSKLTLWIQEKKADVIIESLLFPVKPQDINIPSTNEQCAVVTVTKQEGNLAKLNSW